MKWIAFALITVGYALWGLGAWTVMPFVTLAGVALTISGWVLRSRLRPARAGAPAPSTVSRQAWAQANGVWVLAATAVCAVGTGVADYGMDALNGWTVALVLILSVMAIALTRFVARHGDEIGEARFDTRNPERWQP